MIHIERFTFNPFSENTYILYTDSGSAILIDPGNFQPSETAQLKSFIESKTLKIEKILLTHAHIDHVFGLEEMLDYTGAPLYMHENEKEILDHNPKTAEMFGFEMKPLDVSFTPLRAGDTVSLGEENMEVRFVPGHSPGSLAYYAPENGFVISGDALFQESIGRTDLYKGNHQQLLHSIESQLFTLPEHTKVYSGHGESTETGTEKRTNPFFS